MKSNRLARVQLYFWVALAGVSLGWGFISALRPGHSQDLKIIDEWLRTWLRQGANPYYLTPNVANYPPHGIVFLSPLSLIPEQWVAHVWALLNLAIVVLVGYAAFRILRAGATNSLVLVPCAMFLAWAGVRTGLGNGQFTMLMLGVGLLSFLFEEKRPVLGGLFLALALTKPHIGGAFLLWALLTRRWKMSLVACVVMGLGVGIFALRLNENPFESVRSFLAVLQHQFGRGVEVQGSMALRMVELRPLVALFIQHEVWATRVHQLLLVILLGCTGLVALIKCRLNSWQRDMAVLQLCCLWMLMSVFHNPYDTVLLLPVFAGLWAMSLRHPSESGLWQDQAAMWVLQLAMVIELPAIWWRLSKITDVSSYNWAGVLLSNFDRLLVLGLFVFILNRVRLYRLARSDERGAGEMLTGASTTNF